ncbi:hypothetical protein SAMN02745208_02212, partial [Heyndrickxia coagulans DSM 1 = ATCC 7050]
MLRRAKFTRFPRAASEPPRSSLAAGSLLARFSRRSLVNFARLNDQSPLS